MSRRPRPGLFFAAAIAVVASGVVVGGLLVISPDRTEPVRVGDAAEGVLAADAGDRRGLEASEPFVLGGRTFPAGSRREGRRRVVTPDGAVYVRDRGSDEWRLLQAEATPATSPAPAPRRPAARPEQRPGRSPAERAPPGTVEAVLEMNVRPAANRLDDAERAGAAPIAKDWEPAGETIAPSGGGPTLRPRRSPATHVAGAPSVDSEQLDERVLQRHGLRGDYYDFLDGELFHIPDLETVPPTFSRIDLSLDFVSDDAFKLPFPPETFAALWRGYIHAPEAGAYVFTLGSDDGVRLEIGDEVVIEHAGLRAYGESEGAVTLAAGSHPIRVTFYENRVFASCRLFWQGPTWPKRLVPSSALSPPDEVAEAVQPHILTLEPEAAPVGADVFLHGVGFADQPALNRVTFAGVPAEIVAASSERLIVNVPRGASTGDVVVQVGPLSSLPEPFTVETVTGLFAEYFHLGANLDEYPAFDELAPFFVRLDGPLDYHQDNLWGMPYAPDVFAARYTGFLYIPADDDYRITLGCDDGARLSLDGETYIDVPGLHPYREQSRTSHFRAGFHPLELIFFENRGVARLRLFWQRPGEATRSVVPRGFLFPPAEIAEAAAPTVRSAGLQAAIGEELEIEGSGFGTHRGRVRVLFPGDVWARPETASDDRLTVRVPHGVDSGTVRVQAGVLASNATQFVRTTPRGLRANYYVFSSARELEQHANPDALKERTPNLTRVDTNWQLAGPSDWKLPFPAENFAVHWSGRMGLEYPSRFGWLLWADDGAHLYIGGRHVVDCGPFHGLLERGGSSGHGAGEHRIDLYYFQRDGEAKLRFFYNPYGIAEHRPVPARLFTPADE